LLLLAIPNAFEAERILTHARATNPGLRVITRAHSESELVYLKENGADVAVMGEREIARRMSELALALVQA
jgi:monovalent cation:H+ antiporter-2, CPA2 family